MAYSTGNRSLLQRYGLFFLFVGPAVILRLITSVYPLLKTVQFGLMKYNLTDQVRRFTGFDNFVNIATDPTLQEILGFTVIFVATSVVLQLVLGMLIANMLNATFPGRRLVRTINLIPWVIPLIVSGYAFRWLLNGDYGLISDLVVRIADVRPHLLLDAFSARASLIAVNVWRNTPFMGIILLAGLQTIPDELYESARIDGASWFQRFRYITMPASTATIVTLGLFNTIWQMSNIDLVLGVTQGGPGKATVVLAFRIYQQGMLWFDWGLASALSVVLVVLVAMVGLLGLYLFRRYEFRL